MKLQYRLLLPLCVLLICVPGTAAGMVKDGDPGTIGACLAKQDGSAVELTCEQVMWRGKSGKSFALKEPFEKWPAQPRLLVVSTQALPVQAYWSVDLTGTLQTLHGASDGREIDQRALIVSPADVRVYCDARGKPIPYPVPKEQPLSWTTKRPLADFCTGAASTQSGELPDPPDSPDSPPPAAGSKDSPKHLPDGACVSINGIVISAVLDNLYWVEKSDRTFGIWVNGGLAYMPGTLVDISGWMLTEGGQRAVFPDTVTVADWSNYYPRPTEVGMANKALGGGAVEPFTPAVADGFGLNNTGLLVRTRGRVTYVDEANRIYYLDDGSGVLADSGRVGVKVYDRWIYDPLPTLGSFQAISGVSSAETPGGSIASIRTLWKTESVPRSTQPGAGIISGTVTASGANGRKLRVYCGSGSTTAIYSLNVPYGDHAVSASVTGYKTVTQLVNVYDWYPNPVCDFTLPAIRRIVDVAASPSRVPPDGVSEMTITAIVRDEEGRRFENEPVNWTVNPSLVKSMETMTDAVGEARLVIHSTSTAATEAVSAAAGGTTGRCYPEFAPPDAPSVWVMQPSTGETVSGYQEIKLAFNDPGGVHTGLSYITVLVDGVEYATWPATIGTIWWDSVKAPNGPHEIKAIAVDCDGVTSTSNVVTVTSQNEISELSVTPDEVALNQPVHISARLAAATDWTITVTDVDNQTVWSTTGNGATIDTYWQGPTTTGSYEVTVSTAGGAIWPERSASHPK